MKTQMFVKGKNIKHTLKWLRGQESIPDFPKIEQNTHTFNLNPIQLNQCNTEIYNILFLNWTT